ncbi:hypothetical protein B2G88_11045 [Natronolimnobius baerhuensis]|uniref:Uncharacterized protein n=2 Tax=Natronolimnobius baerhuensis TaxID=253108 RepID=A0A202E9E5_9EURY|nr:hypothetical protein B2G88_11045 [Natronolimnobius baerhuensis]
MTPRRALIAPGLSVLGLVAGIGRFTYEWTTDMPFEVVEAQPGGSDASRTVDWPMHMIVQMDLGAAHFASLTASSMVVIGAIAAQRGWRRAAKSALVPAAILGFDIAWTAAVPSALESSVLTVLLGVPFAVGYVATRTE